MNTGLIAAVDLLLLVAIGVQVYFLRGLAKAGVKVSKMTKVVSYGNIVLLAALMIGLTALAVGQGLPTG